MHYNPALDGLRAIAVLFVVAFHCKLPFLLGGFVGVEAFFVLSGFLITGILRYEVTRSGTLNLMQFYANRALRLYPPLLVMLAAWAVLMPLVYSELDVLRNAAIAALYLSDYVLVFGSLQGHLGHTWSLAVEEHFYLIWPLIVLATARMRNRLFLAFLILLFLAATAWRVADFLIWSDWHRTYHRFDTALSGMILGGVASTVMWRVPPRQAAILGIVALYVLALCAIGFRWGSPFAILYGASVVQVTTATLLLCLREPDTLLHALLSWRPLAHLGLLSYSIYLWHFPIAAVLRKHVGPWETFAIVLTVSDLVSAASYRWLEGPIRAWRHQRRRAAAAPQEASRAIRA